MNPGIFTIEPIAWLLRGGLFLGGALVGWVLLRRRSAAWLAFYWRSAMLAALALVGVTLAGWRAPSGWVHPEVAPPPAKVLDDDFTESTTVFQADSPRLPLRVEIAAAPGSETRWFPWPTMAWSVWGFGSFVVLVRWMLSLVRRCRLAQAATALKPDDSWFALLRDIAPEARLPRLLRHPTATVPCAWGLWRPTILLPAAADQWPLEHRRLAFAHEWAHLQRGDPFWQTLSVLVLALHWANPLAWLAIRRWRLAEEQAADDAALHHAEPSSYATLLVQCARSTPTQLQPPNTMFPHFSMAHPSTVPQRVERVLNPRQDRRRPGFIRCSAFALALGGAAFACINLTPGLAAADDKVPKEAAETKAGEQAADKSSRPASGAEPVVIESITDGSQGIKDKLRTLMIPGVAFEQATIEEAVTFLRVKSRELDTTTTDPGRKGVNFILRLHPNGMVPKISSLNLTNVPLGVAVKAVVDMAGLRSRIEPYAVTISPADSETELDTKVFRVPPDFVALSGGGAVAADGSLQPRATAMDVLKQAGVAFPEIASAFFSPSTSLLTVRNTPSNLDMVSAFVESISSRLPKMINLRAEFYRMPGSDALELVDQLDSALDATAFVKKLRVDSTGSEKIKLLAAPSLQTRSGQRARVQSGRGQPARPPENALSSPKVTEAKAGDFEGCRFEAEPILGGDGHTLEVAAQFTYGAPPREPGERSTIGSLSISTTLYVGQTRLVGTLSGGEEDDSVILVFLKAALASYR